MNYPPPLCGPDGTLITTWNYALVALSYVVAVAGSFVALDWADRMRAAADRRERRRYFLAGATLMGVSVWTMHFVGMIALHLGIAVQYDPVLSIASIVAAALGAGLAFLIVNRTDVTGFTVGLGGVAMGLAIASMHYLGMASMRMPAIIRYDPLLFAASVAIAIAASSGALMMARRPRGSPRQRPWVGALRALAMGFAIAGMHYVGMAAASYVPGSSPAAGEGSRVGDLSLQNLLLAAGALIAGALIALASRHAAERQAALESLEEKSAELAAASHAKDIFLASLSHELRTPLNPARLLATDSAGNRSYPPEARQAFAQIAENIALESRLIDDLLDLTRISRGILRMDTSTVDVHAILHEAIDVVKPALAEKDISLAEELRATDIHATADAARLKQVFWNLLQNAVKFSESGGTITVTTVNAGNRLEVRVCDTGLGMSPAEVGECFESFTQGDHRRGGLGMGLSISRNIVELLGGAIVATSPGRGLGSAFTVSIPTVTDAAARPAPAASYSASPFEVRALSILLVEDHGPSRTVLQSLLQRRGHTVIAAANGGEALAAGRNHRFDIVVSDIGLPDQDGYQVMQSLRRLQPVVGVAVTGYGMHDDVRRATEAGFVAHVTKPVTMQQLNEALARATAEMAPKTPA